MDGNQLLSSFFSEKFLGLVSSFNKTILCNDKNKDIDKLCVEHVDRGNGSVLRHHKEDWNFDPTLQITL